MARELIKRYSDRQIRAVAPTDVENQTVLNDAASASSSFKVYDPSKDEVLSADEAIAQTELNTANAGVFDEGDSVEVTQDNGTLHSSTISSIDAVAGTITLASGLTVAAGSGNRVRVIFGAQITMDEYGTANINTRDWGYQGLFANDHVANDDPRAKDGLEIDIEIRFNGGTGLVAFDVICALLQEDDCG